MSFSQHYILKIPWRNALRPSDLISKFFMTVIFSLDVCLMSIITITGMEFMTMTVLVKSKEEKKECKPKKIHRV